MHHFMCKVGVTGVTIVFVIYKIYTFVCVMGWHDGAVISTLAPQQEGSGFKPWGRLGPFYTEFACSSCAFMCSHSLKSKDGPIGYSHDPYFTEQLRQVFSTNNLHHFSLHLILEN